MQEQARMEGAALGARNSALRAASRGLAVAFTLLAAFGCGGAKGPPEALEDGREPVEAAETAAPAGAAGADAAVAGQDDAVLPPALEGEELSPQRAPGRSCVLDGRIAYDEGLAHAAAGRPEDAFRSLRCAAWLRPYDEEIREARDEVEHSLHATLLARAQELVAEGRPELARQAVLEAMDLSSSPDGFPEGRRWLERAGYRLHRGLWVHTDEIPALEKREERLAGRRRTDLELDAAFRLDRRGSVRIFTDVTDLAITRKLHGVLGPLELAYRRLFAPLGPAEGAALDIVIYRKRADYERRTGSGNTLGMFLPERGASFFFLGDRSFEETTSVFVHEVCHQLDDRLLGLRRPPPWLQEGLAVCFEGSPDGTALGRLPPDQVRRAREALEAGGERWWGPLRLAGATSIDGLHGTDAVHDFHAQSAFLVACLIQGDIVPVEVFYRIVDRACDPKAGPASAVPDLEAVLGEAGVPLRDFEDRFRNLARVALR